jgi:RNA 2',3'-cyclic 3'-phosphodiesterase
VYTPPVRLFIAIELPEPVRQHLFRVATEMKRVLESRDGRPAVSWTRESNLHVTLKFLGEVPDAQVSPICDALRTVKQSPPALHLRPDGIDAFPSRNAARVLVARVAGDVDRLVILHALIEARCATLGFPRENRRYRPHVTVGRPREPLRGAWDDLQQATSARFPGPEFEASGFSLVQSKLNPAGAIYTTVATFPAFA